MYGESPVERKGITWCKNLTAHSCTDECETEKAIVPTLLERERHLDMNERQYEHMLTMGVVKKLFDFEDESAINRTKNIIMMLH